MKTKILEALKTKFPGVQDSILERIAAKKAENVTDENQVTAIMDGVSFQDVVSSYGDYRANEATATSVRNYEEKHGIKDGKPVKKDGEGKGGNEDGKLTLTQEQLDDLLNKKVEEAMKPYKEKEAQTTRQTLIANEMKALGLTDEDMKFITVPEGQDVKTFLTDVKQDLVNRGLKPATDQGSPTSEAEAIAEVAKDWMEEAVVK